MGKKNKSSSSLGRALIKDRFGSSKVRRGGDVSMLHTTDIEDGYDWGRLNLQSVTEESSFQEFLSTAELASTEFQAEKLNITFVNPLANVGLLSKEERESVEQSHEEHKGELQIPRRPPWNSETTAEELDTQEKHSFLEWRRRLAMLQEAKGLLLTPYEKNLEFWRQLWRVVERSDAVVQIVDARNPLLFRCPDLEAYVKEVSVHKVNLTLINKADFLTDTQRKIWADYFDQNGVRVAFFSAALAAEELEQSSKSDPEGEDKTDKDNSSEEESSDEDEEDSSIEGRQRKAVSETTEQCLKSAEASSASIPREKEVEVPEIGSGDKTGIENPTMEIKMNRVKNSPQLLSRLELISFLKQLHEGPKVTEGVTTIGLVGYPNVGKSSTINSLMADKKVSVSATPGKTKHFQTLYLDADLLLCDCPGLVMPSFVSTRAEMVLNGILPIDQLRDHVEPINLLSSLIPRHVLEDAYGIMLPPPPEGEDPTRPPTPQELLNAYGYNRGFMTHKGIPDNPRAARFILKDFVNGKLLYSSAPPGMIQDTFHTFPERQRRQRPPGSTVITPQGARIMKPNHITTEDLDKVFFKKASVGAHSKGRTLIRSGPSAEEGIEEGGKPWKKHNNRHKKEKLRRIYGHLDA